MKFGPAAVALFAAFALSLFSFCDAHALSRCLCTGPGYCSCVEGNCHICIIVCDPGPGGTRTCSCSEADCDGGGIDPNVPLIVRPLQLESIPSAHSALDMIRFCESHPGWTYESHCLGVSGGYGLARQYSGPKAAQTRASLNVADQLAVLPIYR